MIFSVFLNKLVSSAFPHLIIFYSSVLNSLNILLIIRYKDRINSFSFLWITYIIIKKARISVIYNFIIFHLIDLF